MKKLKDLVNESAYLKREFGDPLPTLKGVMEKHQSNEDTINAKLVQNEGKFVKGFWVRLFGPGKELDSKFAKSKKEIKYIIRDWANKFSFNAGDSIKIEKGQLEETD